MKLPIKISPCPLIEASIEIRFDSRIPSDAVFGVLYSRFQEEFPTLEKLPILQLPEEIRIKDPNLQFQPYYKLINDNIVLQIGPKVITIGCINEYIGWSNFSRIVKNNLKKTKDSKIIARVTRFGLRYINYFDLDIMDKINMQLTADKLSLKKVFIKTSVMNKKFANTLQIANNASMKRKGVTVRGSIIDIDFSISNPKYDILPNLAEIIEDAHTEEKKLFYSLLKEDFIAQLNPEY